MKYLFVFLFLGFLLSSIFAQDVSKLTNVAVKKIATQSSLYGEADASRAIDGNMDGNYYNNSVTHTNEDINPWWQVDLGSTYDVTRVIIHNRTDACSDRLLNFWVFVSKTPFTSNDLAVLKNDKTIKKIKVAAFPNPKSSILFKTQGRYVRVQIEGTQYLSLAEVEVMGILFKKKMTGDTGVVPVDGEPIIENPAQNEIKNTDRSGILVD